MTTQTGRNSTRFRVAEGTSILLRSVPKMHAKDPRSQRGNATRRLKPGDVFDAREEGLSDSWIQECLRDRRIVPVDGPNLDPTRQLLEPPGSEIRPLPQAIGRDGLPEMEALQISNPGLHATPGAAFGDDNVATGRVATDQQSVEDPSEGGGIKTEAPTHAQQPPGLPGVPPGHEGLETVHHTAKWTFTREQLQGKALSELNAMIIERGGQPRSTEQEALDLLTSEAPK